MKKTIKEEIKTKGKGTSKAFSVYMKLEVHNKIKMYKQAHGTKSVNEAIEELVEKGLEYSNKTEQKYINVLTDLREQSKFNNQKIHIEKQIEDIQILGYENELIQALINILNNARDELIKLSDTQEKLIFIDIFKNKEDKLEIAIKDNAGGIKEEFLDKIFEPYFSTKHKSQGTGIGLYMTEEIIIKHLNGEIFVENKEFIYEGKNYKGALFRIILVSQ